MERKALRILPYLIIIGAFLLPPSSVRAKYSDIYTVGTKQNSYILLDNSGSMDYGVYEQSIDYGAMYDYLVSLTDATPYSPTTYDSTYIADTINGNKAVFYGTKHKIRNKIYLAKGAIGVTIATVDGKSVAFTGDAGNPQYLWYDSATDMVDTHTIIDSDGNLTDDGTGLQRVTVNGAGYVCLDGVTLPIGMNILLHDYQTLYDGSIVDNGFGGLLNAPGYYFSGYEGIVKGSLDKAESGDADIFFFITGNWMNMQAMYNLHYVNNPGGLAVDSSNKVPAWKYEHYPISAAEWSEIGHTLKYPDATAGDPVNLISGVTYYAANVTEASSKKTITSSGAQQIQIHFSSIDIKPKLNNSDSADDWVKLYDNDGVIVAKYNNNNLPASGWSSTIYGDTVQLKFSSGSKSQGTGYVIDKIRVTYHTDAYLMQNRLDIAKDAIEYTLEKFQNRMNWGFATFNYNNYGSAIGANMRVLLDPTVAEDTQRSNILTQLESIEPLYGTPLGEALQDVFEKGFYAQKAKLQDMLCRKNYVIVVTDGFPSGDDSWNRISSNTVNPTNKNGVGTSTFTDLDGDGWTEDPYQYTNPPADYYDDVATYLYNHSWQDHSKISDPASSYVNVIPHQISFGAVHPLLQNAAKESGAQYITAYNKSQLVAAFYSLTLQMANAVSFTAPVVSVDSDNKTENGDDIYLGLFLPQDGDMWAGNLKKFVYGDGSTARPDTSMIYDGANNEAIDADGKFLDDTSAFWTDDNDYNDSNNTGMFEIKEDGAGEVLVESLTTDFNAAKYWTRNIYTVVDGAMSKFTRDNITATMLGVDTDTERDALVNYIHGYTQAVASTDDGTPSAVRDWILGAIVHSRPVVVDYYGSDYSTLVKRYVVVGANDGMLHVFDDTPGSGVQGHELFAFIPPDLLSKLQSIPENDLIETVDGPITLYRKNQQPKYLIFGEGRGGNAYWCLDISNTDPLKWSVKWNYTNSEIQQSWSKVELATVPVAIDKKTGVHTFKDVAIFTGGYDVTEDSFPEPFNDLDYSGTPYDSSVAASKTIDADEWVATDPTQDIDGDGQYSLYNSGTDEKGRGLFIVDIDDPANSTTDVAGNTLLPFQVTYGSADVTSGNVQTLADMKYCFPAAPSVVKGAFTSYYLDSSSGTTILAQAKKLNVLKTIYFTDIYGNVFRTNFDFETKVTKGSDESKYNLWTYNIVADNWSVKKIFSANPGSLSVSGTKGGGIDNNDLGRKIFYSPEISWGGSCKYFYSGNYYFSNVEFEGKDKIASLFFGTGDREHPTYKLVRNRFYAVYDDSSVTAVQNDSDGNKVADIKISTIPYTENNLLNLTCDELGSGSTLTATQKTALRQLLIDDPIYTSSNVDYLENGLYENDAKGWYIVLEDQASCSVASGKIDDTDSSSRDNHVGEAILSQPLLYYGVLYLTSYQPTFDDPCNPQGNGFAYALDYCTGGAAYDLNDQNGTDVELTDRYQKYTNIYGIPSGFTLVVRDGNVDVVASMGGQILSGDEMTEKGGGGTTGGIKNPRGLTLYYWREENSQK